MRIFAMQLLTVCCELTDSGGEIRVDGGGDGVMTSYRPVLRLTGGGLESALLLPCTSLDDVTSVWDVAAASSSRISVCFELIEVEDSDEVVVVDENDGEGDWDDSKLSLSLDASLSSTTR